MQHHQRKVITGQEGNHKNEEDVNIIMTPFKERNIRNLRNEDDLKTEENMKNSAKRTRQHAGNMFSTVCASSMNKSLDPTPI